MSEKPSAKQQSQGSLQPDGYAATIGICVCDCPICQQKRAEAQEREEALLAAHRRVRTAAQARGVRYRVEPQLPLDLLGIYIYLPTA